MKASEVIANLKIQILLHGDLDVEVRNRAGEFDDALVVRTFSRPHVSSRYKKVIIIDTDDFLD